jgi:hypothetical protein
MYPLWMSIVPDVVETRLMLAMGGVGQVLRARFPLIPKQPEGLSLFLRGIAAWHGRPFCAVPGWDDRGRRRLGEIAGGRLLVGDPLDGDDALALGEPDQADAHRVAAHGRDRGRGEPDQLAAVRDQHQVVLGGDAPDVDDLAVALVRLHREQPALSQLPRLLPDVI